MSVWYESHFLRLLFKDNGKYFDSWESDILPGQGILIAMQLRIKIHSSADILFVTFINFIGHVRMNVQRSRIFLYRKAQRAGATIDPTAFLYSA